MKIGAIASWFGSKRTMAPLIVEQLGEHKYFFEPFCGGMCIILAKEPSSNETVCDLHGDLTNLAWVLQDEKLCLDLYLRESRTLYDSALFERSRQWIDAWHAKGAYPNEACLEWAYHYFVCSWMGRNGVSGTERVNYQMALRWTGKGGSGPIRFKAAVESIPAWHHRLLNVCVLRKDAFTIFPKLEDEVGLVIYADPPYFRDGVSRSGNSQYVHDFTIAKHHELAAALCRFKKARVVISYYDHPALASLYPGWTKLDCSRQKNLHVQNRRGAGKLDAPEVLLINGPLMKGREDLF